MLKVKHPFNLILAAAVIWVSSGSFSYAVETAQQYKKQPSSLYKDVFDQSFYYEGVNYLHLNRFYRDLFNRKIRAGNVNVFDEVPDSPFFTNRHAKERLSKDALFRGYRETDGPDLSGKLIITKGKFEGLHPGFFVKDAAGDTYLFKFDPVDNFELATTAEIIASRFYYALGYNVPQYTIAEFSPDKLEPAEDAKIVDDTGFKKKLTPEKLEEFLLFVPQTKEGKYRVSASKILAGENKGIFSFHGRREKNPRDPIDHRFRREIRALQVFASWLNNYDTRESNTLDMLVEENGEKILKHYLIDFNAALGSGTKGAKPPMFSHEHMIDYGEMFKAFISLGFWEKPWQKRWREAGEEVYSPAVGYFDNRYFRPDEFKTQLPYYAFKDLTRADGFWAAKIIMSFTDEDIMTMVRAGELSNPEDADYIAKTLIERRDIIGRYWFFRANPLDAFEISDQVLEFKNLVADSGFETAENFIYIAEVVGNKNGRQEKIKELESKQPHFPVNPEWLSKYESVDFLIRSRISKDGAVSPFVLVSISSDGISRIIHED